jgi:DNA-binding beta-propeller fold protein YncE
MKHLSLLVATLIFSATSLSSIAGEKGNAYVSNQDGGITVIDLDSMEATSNIDIQAKSPRGIAVTADGKYLITANKDDGNISIVDRASGQLIKHIAVGKNPEFVRIHKGLVFVSTEPSSKGGPPPKPGEAVKEENDDDKVPAIIAVVDLKKGKKVREIVGGPETEGIEFSKDGKKIIITNEADNTITIHNFGNSYLATLEYGNKFLVLDKKFNVTRSVETGQSPYGISFDRKGERIFVASSKEKALQVYDAKTFEKIKDINTGNRCWHFSFTPDDKQILLACGKSQAVMVIDTETLEKTKEIVDIEMPWGVVTYPKSMGSLDQP